MKFKPQISKRGSKHYFAEVALARGPREMAVTGAGSFGELFGYAWMALLDRGERRLRLFQARDAGAPWAIGTPASALEWVEIPVPALPHGTKELRHLSLAFDQAARHVVAYERAGEIWVRQWDPRAGQYVMRGPWPGVDPVLVMDAVAGFHVPDSDVLLFHLSPDRRNVVMRAQRELFAESHVVESYTEDALLDQAVSLPYQFELLGSLKSDPTGAGLVLRSDLYPIRAADDLGAVTASPPTGAIYFPVVIVQGLDSDDLGAVTASPPTGAIYYPAVVVDTLDTGDLGTAAASPPSAAVYYPVVIARALHVDDLGTATASPPSSAAYMVAVVMLDLGTAPYALDDLGDATVTPPTEAIYEAV